jgi:hypothetical protein
MSEVGTKVSGERAGGWIYHTSPQTLVAFLCVAQISIWTLVPLLAGRSLPLDVVSDGLAWGHEWQWGYFKHPPLPSWEVEAFFDAFGDAGTYLLSQITVGLTYLFVFLLGRELMPPRWAAAGTLLTACVYYFSVPTPEFNHNVAQMPLWAAAILAYYNAITARTLRWWLLLGVVSGLALLTKYASGILLIVIFAHLLSAPQRRAMFQSSGPYVAVVVCLLIVIPHVLWLVHNHFSTLTYAQKRAGQTHGIAFRIIAPLRFLLSQLLDISPALLAAAIAGFLGRESLTKIAADAKFRFLATFAFGPALLTAALSLVTGLGLRDMWAAPMWSLTGLAIVYASQNRWPRVNWSRLVACVCAIFILMPLAYILSTSIVPAWRGRPSRTQWPDREMASAFGDAYRNETGQPLRIVAADGWLAGLVAMRDPLRPSVFTDGDMREAPWITPQKLAEDGALVLWRGDGPPPARLKTLKGLKVIGTKDFSWPDSPRVAPLAIGWGIIRPQQRTVGRSVP